MPFKSAKQKAFLQAKKPEVAKKFVEHTKYTGRGTRARLNTAAEKMMFGRKSS